MFKKICNYVEEIRKTILIKNPKDSVKFVFNERKRLKLKPSVMAKVITTIIKP